MFVHRLQKYQVFRAISSILWLKGGAALEGVYEALTNGQSLAKYLKTDVGAKFKEPLTRQMWQLVVKNNREDFLFAVRRAQCAVRGGSALLVHALQTSFLGRELQPEVAAPFWDSVLHWFCNHDGMWDKDTVHHVLDYIRYQYGENRSFAMKGRTPEALMQATEQWQKQLAKMKADPSATRYTDLGIPTWEKLKETDLENGNWERWKIVQIQTGKQLLTEGRKLNHCVYSYNRAIVAGQTAIFSLRYEGSVFFNITPEKPVVTIELSRAGGKIVQARGTGNRSMTGQERELLREWANKNKFELAAYL